MSRKLNWNRELLKQRTTLTPSGCWEWSGAKRHGVGYGVVQADGKFLYTHRLAYMICIGDIPPKRIVCHRCDNPPCCNPDHLFLGTHKDNWRDMMMKGRGGRSMSYKPLITELFPQRGERLKN